MIIDVLTIFPGYFESPAREGILRIAAEKGLVNIRVTDIRDFTDDVHRSVDDCPYGGGAGMVMTPEPIYRALANVLGAAPEKATGARIVLTTPRGRRFDQAIADELAKEERIVFICGHYEGVDERIHALASDELSAGDYVLSGGEPAVLAFVDSIVRLLPGVLGSDLSLDEESFAGGLLEYPQYTRPREFMDIAVPDVLLSGNHAKISRWRREQAIAVTARRRPDLLTVADLTEEEQAEAAGLMRDTKKGRTEK
ncbi:MAG: tRNA (guanosine(37)-N1)-methyltransferase TrmD [Actinomycetota bacterium]